MVRNSVIYQVFEQVRREEENGKQLMPSEIECLRFPNFLRFILLLGRKIGFRVFLSLFNEKKNKCESLSFPGTTNTREEILWHFDTQKIGVCTILFYFKGNAKIVFEKKKKCGYF